MFNSDTPINNINEDLLDRGKFAQNVADAIKSYSNHESLAIGIYGGWGEGKSSLANMILSEIPNKIGETNYVVINFNPWLYSNTEELITELFKEISSIFNFSDINETKEKTANAIEKVGQGAKVARYLPIPVVKDIADLVSKLFEDYANFLKDDKNAKFKCDENAKTLKVIKNDINNELCKNKIRLIITIDDFDRLSQKEIRLMFQVIKVLGDFQNTIYLLLMDRDVVVSSLKDVQGGDGEDYLKKIIQIPITIPKISNSQLNSVLHKEFEKVLSPDKYEFIKELYNEIIDVCVIPFISNIRDVKRVINLFEFKNSFLQDEVNQADLFALCALELYVPEAYDLIRSSKDILLNHSFKQLEEMETTIHNFDTIINKNDISSAVAKLFLKKEGISKAEKFGRICNGNYFDAFFSLSLPSNIISFHIIESIMEDYNKSQIEQIIISSKFVAVELIKEIYKYLPDCPNDRLKIIFEAIKPHYYQLLTNRGVSKGTLLSLLNNLLLNMNFDDILNCYNNADFNNTISQEVFIFLDFLIAQKHNNNEWLKISSYSVAGNRSSEQLSQLENVCKNKMEFIELFSYHGEEFYTILCVWKKINLDTCKAYVNKFFFYKDNAFKLVLSMVRKELDPSNPSGYVFFINAYELNQLVELKELYKKIDADRGHICNLDLIQKEKIIAFMVLCDNERAKDWYVGAESTELISYESVKEKTERLQLK